jgi:hypothetical protein
MGLRNVTSLSAEEVSRHRWILVIRPSVWRVPGSISVHSSAASNVGRFRL